MYMRLDINQNWTFNEFVCNIKALRTSYERFLTLFNCFHLKEKAEFIRQTRNEFYSLNMEDWKREKLWNYMNGDELITTLEDIANR